MEELRRLRVDRDPRTDVGGSVTSEQSWADDSFETVFAAPTTIDRSASFSQGNWPLKSEQHQSWSKQERERPSTQHKAFRPMLLTAATGGPIASTDVMALVEGDGDCLPVPLRSKWTGRAGASALAATSMSFSASDLQPLLSVAPAAPQAGNAASPATSSDSELSQKGKGDNWKEAIAQCRILRQVSWEEYFGGRRDSSSDGDNN